MPGTLPCGITKWGIGHTTGASLAGALFILAARILSFTYSGRIVAFGRIPRESPDRLDQGSGFRAHSLFSYSSFSPTLGSGDECDYATCVLLPRAFHMPKGSPRAHTGGGRRLGYHPTAHNLADGVKRLEENYLAFLMMAGVRTIATKEIIATIQTRTRRIEGARSRKAGLALALQEPWRPPGEALTYALCRGIIHSHDT
jgi:hypothetical protein